jgi:PHD/YefM family antitoxin component YafN of YafNO toxin-antitoxin module
MPDEDSFSFISIDQVQDRFSQLHESVCRARGRVEIKDGSSTCVLISKEELESLEQALEILSNTADVRKIAQAVSEVTHAAADGPLVEGAKAVHRATTTRRRFGRLGPN